MIANESIKLIQKEFNENINSHVFLVETNNQEKCLKDIKELIKSIIATDDEIKKHQIDEETYLELIIIKPDGKDIKKDQIMDLQNRIKTTPIQSDYMIYIICNADKINEIATNKLLKTIEEPNQNVIGFLITSNIDIMLPTIKSRCTHSIALYETGEQVEIEEEVLNIAGELIKAIEDHNHIEYYKIKSNEAFIKENHKTIEKIMKDYYNTACNLKKNNYLDESIVKYIRSKNTYEILLKKTKYLNKTLNKLISNMNTDLLLEKIYIEMMGVK